MRQHSRSQVARAVLLAASCALLFTGCATFLNSTAGAVLLQLAPVGLDLFSLPAKLELKVKNPSKLTVSVTNIRYEVIIEGGVVASGEQAEPVTVGPEGSTVVSVPLSVKPGSVLTSVKSSLAKKSVKYQVRGSYSIAAMSEQEFTAQSLLKAIFSKPPKTEE